MNWRDNNELAKTFDDVKRHIRYVLNGSSSALVLSGAPGMGKTHTVEAAIAEAGAKVIRSQPTDKIALLNAFEAADGRFPLILDEGDALMNKKECLDVLKIALDRSGRRSFVYEKTQKSEGSSKRERKKVEVNVRAPVILMSNANPFEAENFRAHPADIAAVAERIGDSHFHISAEREPTLEFTLGLAVHEGSLRFQEVVGPKGRWVKQPVSLEVQNAAVSWFYVHADQLPTVSPRQLGYVRDAILREPNRTLWERDLSRRLDTDKPLRPAEAAPIITPPRKETV